MTEPESKGMACTKSMEEWGPVCYEQPFHLWMDIGEAPVVWGRNEGARHGGSFRRWYEHYLAQKQSHHPDE